MTLTRRLALRALGGLAALALLSAAALAQDALRVAVYPSNPPWQNQTEAGGFEGFEVDIVGSITSNWSVTANYANNETMITEDPRPAQVGTRFPNAPKHSAGLWTRYDIENLNIGIAGGATYVDKRDTFDTTVLPSYTIFDAALFYDWRNYTIALNIKNLTDERYYSGGYNNYQIWVGSPRNLNLTVRAKL